jgi:membrane protease YdiL (CAAX protease family)
MTPETSFSRSFVDLARMGRTDWRSIALTLLLVKSLSFLFVVISVIVVVSPSLFQHTLSHIPGADKIMFDALEATACILGFWLACKKVLQRPFRSLISSDMTFKIQRCLIGAALYLAANALSLMAISLFTSMRAGAWSLPFRQFEWPQDNILIFSTIGMLSVIPFIAFAEELFFRSWLTQTLRRYIRSTSAVVLLVAVLFAAYHTQYDLREKMLILVDSLGLSVLSLRDQRLELAIGSHSMMNVCVTLQTLFLTGPLPGVHIAATRFDWYILVVMKGALPFALMYVLLQRTKGWSAPIDACLASSGDVQPRTL